MEPAGPEEAAQPEAAQTSLLDDALLAMREALQLAGAALALLRAELRLARSSALAIIALGLALVFFGVGAWLATGFAIALGIEALSGSFLLGACVVAAINFIGAAWVLYSMRRCWRDLGLPRTRALISSARAAPTAAGVDRSVQEPPP